MRGTARRRSWERQAHWYRWHKEQTNSKNSSACFQVSRGNTGVKYPIDADQKRERSSRLHRNILSFFDTVLPPAYFRFPSPCLISRSAVLLSFSDSVKEGHEMSALIVIGLSNRNCIPPYPRVVPQTHLTVSWSPEAVINNVF